MADDTRADEDEERAVVRAAQGDGAAFLRLAAAYRPRIVAFLARLADPRAVALDEVAMQAPPPLARAKTVSIASSGCHRISPWPRTRAGYWAPRGRREYPRRPRGREGCGATTRP